MTIPRYFLHVKPESRLADNLDVGWHVHLPVDKEERVDIGVWLKLNHPGAYRIYPKLPRDDGLHIVFTDEDAAMMFKLIYW